jgi:hypothetical protein
MTQQRQQELKLPECGIFFGSGVYNGVEGYLVRSGRTHTAWIPKCHSPLEVLEKVIEENQGNLVQFWGLKGGWGFNGERSPVALGRYLALEDIGVSVPEPDWDARLHLTTDGLEPRLGYPERYGAGALKFLQAAAQKGVYTIFIYCDARPEWVAQFREAGSFYLGYDFGERYSFRLEEEHLEDCAQEVTLRSLADGLMRRVREHVQERKRDGWGLTMATSASFHIDYEIAAGTDVPLAEDFAFSHLNMASALCRGLYRQYGLPIWGAHVAPEHYSWTPYGDPLKFPLLTAGFFQKYMGGSKIILNESGNWFLQTTKSVDSPLFDLPRVELGGSVLDGDPERAAPYVEGAREGFETIGYDSVYARRYRQTISEFYDFVKTNGTPKGQPEVTIAVIKGNLDLCGQEYSPNAAVAGMYRLAEEDPRWYEGAPERAWDAIRNVFFPRPAVLAPYRNRFLSGTPHGMVDIVSFADDRADAAFLQRYRALLFAGWNTMSERQYAELLAYARGGGTLFISIPHLSTDIRRNAVGYTVDDLIHGGDFADLCGVRIRGKGPRFYWATAPDRSGALGFRFPRRFGIFTTCLGELEIVDPEAEVLAVEDEQMRPLLLRRRCGKGVVYFLNSWSYPGALDRDEGPGSEVGGPNFLETIYHHIAREASGSVRITPAEGESTGSLDYIAHSFFPECGTVCVQNIDLSSPRRCVLHREGKATLLCLEPGAFWMFRRGEETPVCHRAESTDLS